MSRPETGEAVSAGVDEAAAGSRGLAAQVPEEDIARAPESGDRDPGEGEAATGVAGEVTEEDRELGIVIPEIRPGEVDPVRIAEALHRMSKVNLDYQRRRLEEGRGIEAFENDPEIMGSIGREEEALGALDPVTGERRPPHRVDTGKMYGLIWWETASANLPVSYSEAVRMAREAKAAVEGAGLGGFEEVFLDPEDDVEAGEDEPPEAWVDPAAAGSAGGETGVSNGDDVGDGGREAVAAGEAEDGSQIDGEEARSEKVAPPGDNAAKSAPENETGVGGEAAPGPEEGQPDRQAIAEVRRAVDALAEGMKETVREEIALRLDGVTQANREGSEMMLQVLTEGVKGLKALIPVFEKGEVAALATSVGSLRESVGELREKLPSVKEGDVSKLIAVLEEFSEKLNSHVRDFNWAREMDTDRGRGRHWLAGAVAVPLLVAVGLFGQHHLAVVPDGTNGWKSLVWERHGIDVAKCMQQAASSGRMVNCPLRVRPR